MIQNPKIGYYESGEILYEAYFVDNKYHRIDGPARIWYYKSGEIKDEAYYINNRRHRTDGPAIIEYYKSGEIKSEAYYVNGNEIDIEKFCKDYGCAFPFNEEDQLIFDLAYR